MAVFQKPRLLSFLSLLIFCSCSSAPGHQDFFTITFPSEDSLPITADEYQINKSAPWILLCHQAGFSRGEYREIAPWLNQLGYNCLAIDQRSGGACRGVENETATRAQAKNLPTGYPDAEQDIRAAMAYLYNKSHQGIILIGSSYSASLVLKIAATDTQHIRAVIAFSPGQYSGLHFELKPYLSQIHCPALATSSKAEADGLHELLNGEKIQQFIPEQAGIHGAKCLWKENSGFEEYRQEVKAFLKGL